VKKLKPKPVKKKHSSVISREKVYLGSLDLKEWWEEFATASNKNGTQKFPTVWTFIKHKAKHGWQRDFLYWLIGPPASEGKSPYPETPQYDWATKRERGFWYSSENIEHLKSEIKRKDTSFARLQTAGESLLDDLAELSELQKQISKEFGGRLFLEKNTAEENSARAHLYLEMRQRVQEMKAHVLQTFAKTQGMDMNQLSNFLELFANGMGAAASQQLGYGGGKYLPDGDGKGESGSYNSVLRQLCDATLKKAADLELELPSEGQTIIKETIEGKTNGKVNGKGRQVQ
jgi:hypothetical protein